MPNKVEKIVSGGQTGADRAALDLAIDRGIAYGGYVPKGRRSEDGTIPTKYQGLIVTSTPDPRTRTRLNVVHSDATLIFTHGELKGGSRLTMQYALGNNKPVLHIDFLDCDADDAVRAVRDWLRKTGCRTLNIAGPRAGGDAKCVTPCTDS